MMYKVVALSGRQRVSCLAGRKAEVIYRIARWSKAHAAFARRGYHLLVFGSIAAACAFQMLCGGTEIWRCEVRGPLPGLPPMCAAGIDDGDFRVLPDSTWPDGTVMAKAVKLTERVWPKEA